MIDQTKYQNYIKLTRQLKGIKFNKERHQLQGTNNKMILAPNNHYMGDMRTQSLKLKACFHVQIKSVF